MKRLTAEQIHDLRPCGWDDDDNGKHYTFAQVKRLMVQVVGKRRKTVTSTDILKARQRGLLSVEDFWWIVINAHFPASEVKALIDAGADPKADDSLALQWAAQSGHAEVVKMLIPVSDPKADDSLALRWAAQNGHAEVVKMLIPVSDPKADDSLALQWAAYYGHAEIVKMLIDAGADPKADDSFALRLAAGYGHAEIVKMLIPVSDPKANNSYALRWAAQNGHAEIVKMLEEAIKKQEEK